jgi:hypothetical protein
VDLGHFRATAAWYDKARRGFISCLSAHSLPIWTCSFIVQSARLMMERGLVAEGSVQRSRL